MTQLDRRLTVLLRDYGYRVEGNLLISTGIRGFSADRIVGRCPDLLGAAESLIPTIREDDYYNRLCRIRETTNH